MPIDVPHVGALGVKGLYERCLIPGLPVSEYGCFTRNQKGCRVKAYLTLVSRVARESARRLLPPDGLAPWRQTLMLRCVLVRERLRHSLRDWLDGVSDALCISSPLAPGLRPLRHSGNAHGPTPTEDYAPSLRSLWRAAIAMTPTNRDENP